MVDATWRTRWSGVPGFWSLSRVETRAESARRRGGSPGRVQRSAHHATGIAAVASGYAASGSSTRHAAMNAGYRR